MKSWKQKLLFTVYHMPFTRNSFTLAEVLITLGIIGVVAAITIPVLMNNIQDAQYKTAYKKAFSVANQALEKANSDYLLAPTTGEGDINNANNFLTFLNQFKVSKKCINTDNEQCWDNNGEKFYSGGGYWPQSASYAFIDQSGMAWSMYYSGLMWVFVDTNGFKGPNQYGKDRFALKPRNQDNLTGGTPVKFIPFSDNDLTSVCVSPNKCATQNNYYGTSWLYN